MEGDERKEGEGGKVELGIGGGGGRRREGGEGMEEEKWDKGEEKEEKEEEEDFHFLGVKMISTASFVCLLVC